MSEKSAQTLWHYMAKHRMNRLQLAEHFHLCRLSISKYLKGHNIHPKIRQRIEEITSGEVKATDLS